MKAILPLLLPVLLVSACGGRDSLTKANETNDQRIEQQAAGISDEAKATAKKVAELMVDLSDLSLTQYELSRLAVQKAVNPEVKRIAQRTIDRHSVNEKQLRSLVQGLRLVTPTELSDDGEDRLEELRDQPPGTAFDLHYLQAMAELHADLTDLADDLADEAPNDSVRDFARRLEEESEASRELIRSLQNALN